MGAAAGMLPFITVWVEPIFNFCEAGASYNQHKINKPDESIGMDKAYNILHG